MKQYSFFMAVAFIINIMIGSGIFLNTLILEKFAPHISFLSYILVGLLMAPIVAVSFQLLKLFPGESLYAIGMRVRSFLGFFLSWGYFFGKLGTVAIGFIIASKLFLAMVGYAGFACTTLAQILLAFSLLLIGCNVQLGSSTAAWLCIAKLIPILSLICAGIFKKKTAIFSVEAFYGNYPSLISCIPFVIFSFAGFESFFAVASQVKNPSKNAARVVGVAFALVVAIYVAYQACTVAFAGPWLEEYTSFENLFRFLLKVLYRWSWVRTLCMGGVICSAFGAAYGVLYSNSWNLYYIANSFVLARSSVLGRFAYKTAQGVPLAALLFAGMVVSQYITRWGSNISVLQQLAAFATFVAYSLCVYIYFKVAIPSFTKKLIIFFSLISCLILFAGILMSALTIGYTGYIIYCAWVLAGIVIYYFGSDSQKSAYLQHF